MPAPALSLPQFVGMLDAVDGQPRETVARARTLGQCIDFAMDTSKRRAGARVSIFVGSYDGRTATVHAKPILEIRNAGRGTSIVSHITEMPDRPEVVAAAAAAEVEAHAEV